MTGQYLLFCADRYYPCGGWRDYQGRYATLEAALEAKNPWLTNQSNSRTWEFAHYHVVDAETGEIVAEGGEE